MTDARLIRPQPIEHNAPCTTRVALAAACAEGTRVYSEGTCRTADDTISCNKNSKYNTSYTSTLSVDSMG